MLENLRTSEGITLIDLMIAPAACPADLDPSTPLMTTILTPFASRVCILTISSSIWRMKS